MPGSGKPPDQREEALKMSIAGLNLPLRTANMLEGARIDTVEDLLNTTEAALLDIANFGQKALQQCLNALGDLGFQRETRGN